MDELVPPGRRRRPSRWAAAVLAAALVAAACGDDGDNQEAGAGGTGGTATEGGGGAGGESVELELWLTWSGEVLEDFQPIIDRFEADHPGVTVEIVEGQVDPAVIATAIAGGNAPDAVLSFKVENLGQYCAAGAWEDLTPRIEADGLDMGIFPPVGRATVTYEDKICGLPYTAGAYGLYYNRELLEAAGFTEPPRTMAELVEMSKAVTRRGPDGSIEVAGFVPLLNFYQNYLLRFPMLFDADYFDGNGQPALSTDEDWRDLFAWQRELVDFYGRDELTRFVAELGDEWSAAHAFHQGQLAFHLDGEWRTQMLNDLSPDLDYGTAAMPVSDDHPDLYGNGHVTVAFLLLPDGAEHPDEAWELIEFLATDTESLVQWINRLQNLPTTIPALESPDLALAPEMEPFLGIYAHPDSSFPAQIEQGPVYFPVIEELAERWMAGEIDDLEAALAQADQDISALLDQG